MPDEILNRRKMGFGVPLAKWFSGPMSGYIRETLLSPKAKQRGYFKMERIQNMILEHQKGVRDHSYKLWALLMFELWHQVYMDHSYHFSPQAVTR